MQWERTYILLVLLYCLDIITLQAQPIGTVYVIAEQEVRQVIVMYVSASRLYLK